MSVPKVKCLSCGSEWAGPVVFCGECGAVISAAPPSGADRVARVPPAPAISSAATPAGKGAARGGPRTGEAREGRLSRPGEVGIGAEARRTVLGMPAAVPVTAPPESARGGRREASKKGRKSSANLPVPSSGAEETEKLLEALDAGFDSISRPSEADVVPITPSHVPELPAEIAREAAPDTEEPEIVISEVSERSPLLDHPAAGVAQPAAGPRAGGDARAGVDEETRRAQHESDMAEVRALFIEMAAMHARPLRDFMIEVSSGDPAREWLDVAAPATAGLRRACEALEMPDLGAALDGFSAALELAAGEASIHREVKDLLLGAYGKLTELMPAAFALEGERGRREPIIVRSLLLQVPGVHQVALDKIYAAGLMTLEMLFAAGAKELAETTGLDVALCARIHDRLQRYRREAAEIDPGRDRAAERGELSALLGELMGAHAEHERVASGWSKDDAARRARARKERNDVMLRVNVLLAHMGEVDRLKALEKAPFAQKIQILSSFLEEAQRKASRS